MNYNYNIKLKYALDCIYCKLQKHMSGKNKVQLNWTAALTYSVHTGAMKTSLLITFVMFRI